MLFNKLQKMFQMNGPNEWSKRTVQMYQMNGPDETQFMQDCYIKRLY